MNLSCAFLGLHYARLSDAHPSGRVYAWLIRYSSNGDVRISGSLKAYSSDGLSYSGTASGSERTDTKCAFICRHIHVTQSIVCQKLFLFAPAWRGCPRGWANPSTELSCASLPNLFFESLILTLARGESIFLRAGWRIRKPAPF